MVQEYQSPVRVYKHPFELIMAVSSVMCFHAVIVDNNMYESVSNVEASEQKFLLF